MEVNKKIIITKSNIYKIISEITTCEKKNILISATTIQINKQQINKWMCICMY